ncbi:MAG: hypothetical protein ACJ8FY_06525 [Gemmataceae bacterium]
MPFLLQPTAALVLAIAAGPAHAAPPLTNADFESGQLGKVPPGWALRAISARQGFTARLTDQNPAGGKQSLELACKEFLTFGPYGAVSQSVPADTLRGKRVRFRAKVRTSGLANFAAAGLFARVHRPDFRPGHCAEMNDHPERGKEWVERSVVVDVAADAERLEVGFVLHMAGTAWFDDAALEVLGPAGVGNVPPGPLSDRGRANLTAFARLLAYVRFFHPSDASAATDWGRFAVGHVEAVEAARSPDELATCLTELFAPLAPTLRTYVTGKAPPAVAEPAAPSEGAAVRLLAWRHLGSNPNGLHGHYRSDRVADRDLPGATPLKLSPAPLPPPRRRG